MKKIMFAVCIALCAVSQMFAQQVIGVPVQRKVCIDRDWKFCYGDGHAAIDNASTADAWRSIDLPHDWSVETEAAQKAGGTVIGPFSTNSVGKYQTGHTVGGEGWYIKTCFCPKRI